MENNNTLIIASTLAPSAFILATVIVLTVRFHRANLRNELPAPPAPTVIINQQINPQNPNNDIPLQPYLNPIHTPILR